MLWTPGRTSEHMANGRQASPQCFLDAAPTCQLSHSCRFAFGFCRHQLRRSTCRCGRASVPSGCVSLLRLLRACQAHRRSSHPCAAAQSRARALQAFAGLDGPRGCVLDPVFVIPAQTRQRRNQVSSPWAIRSSGARASALPVPRLPACPGRPWSQCSLCTWLVPHLRTWPRELSLRQ